jgi:hypothetical protein
LRNNFPTTTSPQSKSKRQKALGLHRQICSELDPQGFTLQEVRTEFGSPNGGVRFSDGAEIQIDALLDLLVNESYLERTSPGHFCVLREVEDAEAEADEAED